jgi:hypothetical protein
MLPAANVTARQRGRRSGGAPRLAAAVLLLELLALCCLARADAAASLGRYLLAAHRPLSLPFPSPDWAFRRERSPSFVSQIRAYHT